LSNHQYARGDIVLCADKSADFTGKPRPFLIVQKTIYIEAKDSLLVCPISTVLDETGLRVRLNADKENGLVQDSDVHTDKVSAIKKLRVKQAIGKVSKQKMLEVSNSLKEWLDL
jgi:mRNA interferase MazF